MEGFRPERGTPEWAAQWAACADDVTPDQEPRPERNEIAMRLTTARVRNTDQLRWCLRLIVGGTSLNVETYGETPAEAFADMADALTIEDTSTLKWAVDHA